MTTATPTTTSISIRMDKRLKEQAESLFDDLGINMTTAMVMFAKAAVREQRIPFELKRDPFWSATNQAHLQRAIERLNATGGTEHDLLNDEEDDARHVAESIRA